MQKVRMIKSQAPDEIPNGSIGVVVGGDITRPGLAFVRFKRKWFGKIWAFVYPNEVELIEEATDGH